ncbi:MAG TPA: flagellin, partial [Firmicutes bacterium]|nr:flagellin [Bacillota bacterium]
AVQSASDTVTDADREEIQKEMNALRVEIDRISNDTEFNTQKLLEGNFTNRTIHIGANANQNLMVSIDDMAAEELGVHWIFSTDAGAPNVFMDKLAVSGTLALGAGDMKDAVSAKVV